MNRIEPLRPCPHCGSEMRAGSLKRHAPICVKNPAAYARYCEVLASAPGSKTGITCGRYVELSTADKTLPTVITLRRLAGAVTWDAVLTVFGLEPPPQEQKHSQCPHCGKFVGGANMAAHAQECQQRSAEPKPKLQPAPQKIYTFKPKAERKPRPKPTPQICPACGVQRLDMSKHICPESPAIVAWLAQVLPDPEQRGCIITCAAYKALPERRVSMAVLSATYDSWSDLAARYGLKTRTAPPIANSKLDAASVAELHRLAQELHAGEFGPSLSEYQMYATNVTYKAAGLAGMYGQRWASVLEAAGLRNGTRSEYTRAARVRRKAHEAARAAQRTPVASKYERGDEGIPRGGAGLPISSVQKPVPIVRPDEVYKGYVRTMIR